MSFSGKQGTKPHYGILDALRGVAALMVVLYHICEGYAFAGGDAVIRTLNHGYLAVDFFFLLSGFVLGYAYDDRWHKGFTIKDFFRRRLVRLHPMVIMGALIGVAAFLLQGSVRWDGSGVALPSVLLAFVCAICMVPAVPGGVYEIRGNGEMFPLNGPAWSLFFEYIGNILYALFLRRLPTWALACLSAVLGVALCVFTVGDVSGYGSLGVGWTLDGVNFCGGLLRMLFPFTMGMLISRIFRPIRMKGAFPICSVALVLLFAVPFIGEGSDASICLNGIYESVCIMLIFPALLWLAASEGHSAPGESRSGRLYSFLGDLSYPLYITHYPVMYLFYWWMMQSGRHTFALTWWQSIAVYVSCLLIALVCLRFYDAPLRSRLQKGKK